MHVHKKNIPYSLIAFIVALLWPAMVLGQQPEDVTQFTPFAASDSLTAQPTSLTFNYTLKGTAPAAQTLTIGGTSGLTFTAKTATTSGGQWLSATPESPDTVPGSVTVAIVTTVLTAGGTYSGSVTIRNTAGDSAVVSVTLIVATSITVSPASLSFNYALGGAVPKAQSITVGGTPGVAFTATASTTTGGSWLSATPVSPGTTPGSASVSIVTASLTTAGTYTGRVTIGAAGATSRTVSVTLIVTPAAIAVSPSSISFNYVIGGAALSPLTLKITAPVGDDYTATAGASWLSATPTSGTLAASLSVTANTTGLTVGTYNSTIVITVAGVSNSPFSVPVTLTVAYPPTTIALSTTTLSFTAATGSTMATSQTVNVTSPGLAAVSIATKGGAWITASISAATTPAVVTVSANPSNLAEGIYTATVFVTATNATNSPQNIAVQFSVSAPVVTVSPASLGFAYLLGTAAPASQSISVTSTLQVNFATSITNGSWLTVNSSNSGTPSTLQVSVNPAGLSPGTYNATLYIAGIGASNSPLAVSVALVVSGKPMFYDTPSSLTFTAQSGGPAPAAQYLTLTGSTALQFTVTTSPSWLSVSGSSNITPATLVATVNTQGLAQGSYQGTITITSGATGATPFIIPVTLSLSAAQGVGGPLISNVVNAASYASTGFSPGAIVSIFGSQLGPQTGVSFSVNSQGGLDSTLAGASVTVGGVAAVPLFAQSGQLNVIMPFLLPASGEANVEVEYENMTSTAFNILLAPADVQIFTANGSGSGAGSILNQDFSPNSATNPAAPGSVVLVFGTGAGALTPSAPVIAGNIAGDTPLSWVTLPYSATVNGENAPVLYAGSAPGLVYGVDQFNVQLPADLPAGAQNIVLTVGGSKSQANVTVFVQ
jgi:uncharacterized protein (TIGR03437 family)